MNRLIQGGVDIDEFRRWYSELTREQQNTLAYSLFDVFICEQHYSGGRDVVNAALAKVGKPVSDPIGKYLLDLTGGFDPEKGFLAECPRSPSRTKLIEWIDSLEENDRIAVFELCVQFFGIHEGIRFEDCGGNCQHWWHQDLKNPEVVKKVLEHNRPSAPEPERKIPFFTQLFGGLNRK